MNRRKTRSEKMRTDQRERNTNVYKIKINDTPASQKEETVERPTVTDNSDKYLKLDMLKSIVLSGVILGVIYLIDRFI